MMSASSLGLSAACLLQAVFFIALLATGPAREALWGRLLILLLLAISLEKADQLYLLTGAFRAAPQLALIGTVFGTAVPGLLYLHLRSRNQPERGLGLLDALAALPFAALAVYVIATYHALPLAEKQALFDSRQILDPWNRYVIPLTGDLVWLGFLAASVRELHRHDRRLLDWFSNVENRRLADVRTVLLMICGLVALHFLWTITRSEGLGVALNGGHFLLVNVLGIAALRASPEAPAPVEPEPAEPDGALEPVWSRVADRLLTEALYLDPDLTVAKLARASGERPRQVSEAINRYSGGSFYDLVNAHRIEAAKHQLASAPEMTVLEIAYASGFNSKSAFNTAFKRLVGSTPSAWRAQSGAPEG